MASRITSYNTLVSALTEAAEDVGSELLAFMPVIIDNAENRLARELDIDALVYTSTITASASTAFISKPNGHKYTYHIRYTDSNTIRTTVLRKKADSYLDEYWPHTTSVGTPKYYSDEDRTTIRLAPCCSTDSSIEIKGARRPTVLSNSNQTNVFTSVCPDALYHACMLEVAAWQRNKELFDYHKDLYISTRDSINLEGRRQDRDDGTIDMEILRNSLMAVLQGR